MSYGGGCLIGVEYVAQNVYAGQSPNPDNFSAASSASLTFASWPAYDGAFTPKILASWRTSLPTTTEWWAVTSGNNKANALFAATVVPGAEEQVVFYKTVSGSFARFGGVSSSPLRGVFISRGEGVTINAGTADCRTIMFDHDGSHAMISYASQPYVTARVHNCYCSELAQAQIVEMPNNQQLINYKRTQTAPTSIDIKTMDGAIRRYATGGASTDITATWRWSDDGELARKLTDILKDAVKNVYPLIIYIPQGLYYDESHLDLVVPNSPPAIIMPAPGVYELTIDGSCQP